MKLRVLGPHRVEQLWVTPSMFSQVRGVALVDLERILIVEGVDVERFQRHCVTV
jgi:hypothetical protein